MTATLGPTDTALALRTQNIRPFEANMQTIQKLFIGRKVNFHLLSSLRLIRRYHRFNSLFTSAIDRCLQPTESCISFETRKYPPMSSPVFSSQLFYLSMHLLIDCRMECSFGAPLSQLFIYCVLLLIFNTILTTLKAHNSLINNCF